MKVSRLGPHLDHVPFASALERNLAVTAPVHRAATPAADFDALYQQRFRDVLRWLRALGARPGELEDLAQEVFIVVRRKLPSFRDGNLDGWLYKIAKLTVRDHGRRAWFRRVFRRGGPAVELDELPSPAADPEQALERRERQRLFHRLVAEMSSARTLATNSRRA